MMITARKLKRSEQGFTVAELMVATAILFFALAAIIGGVQFAAASTQQSTMRERAVNLGNRVIEQARIMDYDYVGVDTIGAPVFGDLNVRAKQFLDDEGFRGLSDVDVQVVYARDADNMPTYKVVTAIVSWEQPFFKGLESEVKVESAITGKSTDMDTGHVCVTVKDRETEQPINGARVEITHETGGSLRPQYTGQLGNQPGEALFAYVPTGLISDRAVTVNDDYIMNYDELPDRLEVEAGTMLKFTVYAERKASGKVHVVDDEGKPISGATVRLSGNNFLGGDRDTDAEGQADFLRELLPNQIYRVMAWHDDSYPNPGYASLVVKSSDETAEATVILTRARTLNVTVKNPNRLPVPKAKVQVQGPVMENLTPMDVAGSPKETASSGLASFDLVTSGAYIIKVSAEGYWPAEKNITYEGSQMNVEIILSGPSGSLQVTCAKEQFYGKSGATPEQMYWDGWQNVRITRVSNREIVYEGEKDVKRGVGTLKILGLTEGRYYVQHESGTGKWYPDPGIIVNVIEGATATVILIW